MRRTGLGRHLAVAHDSEAGVTLEERRGDCFRQAFLFADRYGDGGWELVHGHLTGWAIVKRDENGRYLHAWVEKDGMLYEPLHDLIYEKSFYDSFAAPVEVARYPKRAARKRALASGHYGPWEGPDAPD